MTISGRAILWASLVASSMFGAMPAQASDAEAGTERGGNAVDILVTGLPIDTDLSSTSSASRLGLSIQQTPASVESIDGDAIRARGDVTIQDAVSRATGITFAGAPGNGGTALASRGFSGQGSVQLLVDGTASTSPRGRSAFRPIRERSSGSTCCAAPIRCCSAKARGSGLEPACSNRL